MLAPCLPETGFLKGVLAHLVFPCQPTFPPAKLRCRQGVEWKCPRSTSLSHSHFLSQPALLPAKLQQGHVKGGGVQFNPRFPLSSILPCSLEGFFFFSTFFLKVPPHPVVRVHPISLPVLIVLAVNTGCLCIFPAHYQQTALIMQIHPSHCALRSAQTIDQAIKHNQSGRGAKRREDGPRSWASLT